MKEQGDKRCGNQLLQQCLRYEHPPRPLLQAERLIPEMRNMTRKIIDLRSILIVSSIKFITF